jgi:nucleoside-diphosphate-sugar epimerase
MKLLRWGEDANAHVALLFGAGLVGGAVERALRRAASAEAGHLPYDWTDAALRAGHGAAIGAAVRAAAQRTPPARISVIWAGGRSGFGSTVEDMATETALVAEVLDLAWRLRDAHPDATLDIHLLSSAGGLFEGMTHCDLDTPPRALRPYGEGKLAQEALLHVADGAARRRIYRPSSVYGYWPGARFGLISALVGNALAGRVTRIVGNLGTVRDYVLAEDIGRFIAGRIQSAAGPAEATHLLANGRPTSMFEAIALVERVMNARLLLQFDPHPSNALNMSFLPSALPVGWCPTALPVGVDLVAARMRRHILEKA